MTATVVDPILLSDTRRERARLLSLAAPALILVLVLLALPIGWLFWLSFVGADGGLSLENYRRLLDEGVVFNVLLTTFEISAISTVLCLLLSYPVAYLLSELPQRVANLLLLVVVISYWTSILVRTYAWLVLLQRRGVINQFLLWTGLIDQPLALVYNWGSTIVGMVHLMLPFMILPLYSSMTLIDRSYMKAAANLGASPVRAFWIVFLPLSVPGALAGSFLVFVLCIGLFVTPAILGGGRVILVSQQIEKTVTLYSHFGAASALGVVLLVLTLAILLVIARFRLLRLGATPLT